MDKEKSSLLISSHLDKLERSELLGVSLDV